MLPHRTSYATQHHHTRVHHGTHTMVPRSHHRDLLTCTCTASAEHTQQPQTQQPQIHLQRRLLLTLTAGLSMATPLLTSPPRASAYILDEDNASNVFTAAAPSVVGIIDLKVERNGEEVTRVELIDNMGTSTQFDARLVGSDPPTDLAVLRIDAPPEMLAPAAIAPSSALRVGQYVYAIGNPSGLNKTLTSGVVSGLNRSIPSPTGQRIPGVVQTDASISAGNSGGPLLNSSGQVVGINVATFTRSGSGRSSGVNFALPSDLVRRVVPNLIVYGNASGKGLGGR